MKEWFGQFWTDHGDRITFGAMAVVFAISFMNSGIEALENSGATILIGLAMLCFNHARGGNGKQPKDKP